MVSGRQHTFEDDDALVLLIVEFRKTKDGGKGEKE